MWGNSIARGFAYELSAMARGSSVTPRMAQKDACESSNRAYASCTLTLAPRSGPLIHVSYLQLFDTPAPSGMPAGVHTDACAAAGHGNTRECVRTLLTGVQDDDVLVFYVGLHYALHALDVAAVAPDFDLLAHFIHDAKAFREALLSEWHGSPSNIFRVRIAPPRVGEERFIKVTQDIIRMNTAADEIFADTNWSVIDQASLNSGNEKFYTDSIHFQGPLSALTMNVMLSTLCGDPQLLPPANSKVWEGIEADIAADAQAEETRREKERAHDASFHI